MDEIAFETHFYTHDLPELLASPLFREVDRRKCRFIEKHGVPSKDCRVLSLGCGDGRKETGIAHAAGGILGVDICPVAVEQALIRALAYSTANVRFERGDVRKLEFPEASFDLIIAIGILHHFDDAAIAAVLENSLAWLEPGGVLITNDPQDRRLVGLLRPFVRSRYHKYHSEHEHELNAARVAGFFRAAGFHDVAVRYTDFFLDPLAWVFPTFPPALVAPARALDAFLLAIPGLRRFASHFSVVARKPVNHG